MTEQQTLPALLEDNYFRIEQSSECNLPGYLILHLKTPCTSLTKLDDDIAIDLMLMIKHIQQAIQAVIQPEKIYVCSFAEVNPQLHYHIFPRTLAVTEAYLADQKQTAVDGLKLLDWAKNYYTSSITEQQRLQIHQQLQEQLRQITCLATA